MARTLRPLARQELEERDDRIFVIATEDTHAFKQYFTSLRIPRLKITVLATEGGRSAPRDVVERLRSTRSDDQLFDDDQCWLVLDTNHWISPGHIQGTLQAVSEARTMGLNIAFANPCFELWLLLHFRQLQDGEVLSNCDDVVAELRKVAGGYDKSNIRPERFTWPMISSAIARAKAIDSTGAGYWPTAAGTNIYRILEELIAAARPRIDQTFPPTV